jgi:hypothetical protein
LAKLFLNTVNYGQLVATRKFDCVAHDYQKKKKKVHTKLQTSSLARLQIASFEKQQPHYRIPVLDEYTGGLEAGITQKEGIKPGMWSP